MPALLSAVGPAEAEGPAQAGRAEPSGTAARVTVTPQVRDGAPDVEAVRNAAPRPADQGGVSHFGSAALDRRCREMAVMPNGRKGLGF